MAPACAYEQLEVRVARLGAIRLNGNHVISQYVCRARVCSHGAFIFREFTQGGSKARPGSSCDLGTCLEKEMWFYLPVVTCVHSFLRWL